MCACLARGRARRTPTHAPCPSYVFIASLVMLAMDIYRPLSCQAHFSFWRFYWGRALLYLVLGALIYGASAFLTFAAVWVWAMAFIFLVLWILVLVGRSPVGQSGQLEPIRSQPSGSNATPMRSGAA